MTATQIPPVLTAGERVRITLDATVGATHEHSPIICFRVAVGSNEEERIWLSPEALRHVRIQHLAPADGEPRPGDLWADSKGGRIYVAIAVGRTGRGVDLVNVDTGMSGPWLDVHTGSRGPIRLIYRPDRINAGGAQS